MKRCSKGYSLIELLQSLIIFSVVMVVVFGLFVQVKKNMEKREQRHNLLRVAQKAQRDIGKSLEDASGWCWGTYEGFCFVGKDLDTHKVMWKQSDSMLYIDGKKYFDKGVRIPSLILTYVPSPDSLDSYLPQEWFDYLDDDGDRMLYGQELKRIKWLRLHLITTEKGQSFTTDNAVRLPPPLIDDRGYFDL